MNYKKIIDKYYPEEQNRALRDILLVHSRGVAGLCLEILDAKPELLQVIADEMRGSDDAERMTDDQVRAFVEAAAMLHDIGICRCDADGIQCFGTEPYICHGRLGAEMLRQSAAEFGLSSEEVEPYARVCERHTGAGLTAKDIIAQQLPLPAVDMLPETTAEKLICYADKFYSKTRPEQRKTIERAERSIRKFGEEGFARFQEWDKYFNR